LIAGTAISVKGKSPATRVIGAEPAGADDAFRSLQAGELLTDGTPDTIADGLRATLGDLTFPVIKRHVAAIERVSESAIIDATRFVWERMKLIVEPSAAVPVAALMQGELDVAGRRIGVILSGGNVDLDALPWRR
jgi:threonine dehydratase